MPSGFIEAHVYPLRRVSSGSCSHLHIHLSSDIVARFGLIDRRTHRVLDASVSSDRSSQRMVFLTAPSGSAGSVKALVGTDEHRNPRPYRLDSSAAGRRGLSPSRLIR
jgi:hypothetical protein